MTKMRVSVTIDPAVIARTDDDAYALRQNRSEYIERVLRDEHYRRLMARAEPEELSDGEQARLRALLDWQDSPENTGLAFVPGAEA